MKPPAQRLDVSMYNPLFQWQWNDQLFFVGKLMCYTCYSWKFLLTNCEYLLLDYMLSPLFFDHQGRHCECLLTSSQSKLMSQSSYNGCICKHKCIFQDVLLSFAVAGLASEWCRINSFYCLNDLQSYML